MNKEQSLNILEQALNAAAQKGVFNLQDATYVFNALQTIKILLDKEEINKKEEEAMEKYVDSIPGIAKSKEK